MDAVDQEVRPARHGRGLIAPRQSVSLRQDLLIAVVLGALGAIATRINVNIPHTEVFIEIRWTFGLLGAAMLARWWLVILLTLLLCVTGPFTLPVHVVLAGNLLYAAPFVFSARVIYFRWLDRLKQPILVGICWLVLVLVGYQLFNTPLVFGYVNRLDGGSFVAGMVEAWRKQPFLLESVLVAMISALCLVAWRIHAQLQRSEYYVTTTLHSIGDAVIVTDTDAHIRAMNPVAERLTGWSLCEADGCDIHDVFDIRDASTGRSVVNPVARVLAEGVVVGLANHTTLRSREGADRQIADSAAPIRLADGQVIGVVMVFRDVTEEYRAREQLHLSEQRLRMLSEATGVGLIVHREGRLLFANQTFYDMFGQTPERLDRDGVDTIEQIIEPSCVGKVKQRIRNGDTSYETTGRTADGRTFPLEVVVEPVEVDGQPARAVALVDISRRRQLEDQLHQARKMQAVGQLAGGLAHDFNNQLGGIVGYSELLQRKLDDQQLKETVEKILTCARRAGDLTSQLLTFARRRPRRNEPTDVHELIDEVASMLRHSIDRRITIKTNLNARPSTVMGDDNQLQNVLVNLALNARDAMPEGGTLTFDTELVQVDSDWTGSLPDPLDPGTYLQLAVSDTGRGMPPEIRARIFEPFFTTKGEGKGTGMGMATAYGTVRQHGGAINVYSEPGRGTTFRLYLPVQGAARQAPPPTPATARPRSSATVLVGDDEQILRDLLSAFLEDAGHTVHTCADGNETASFFAEHHAEIDVVVLDMVMPGRDGEQTWQALHDIDPNVPVLLSSGYAMDDTIRSLLDRGAAGFIQKPFSQSDLLERVDAALAQGKNSS